MIASFRQVAIIGLIAGCNASETQIGLPVQAEILIGGGVDQFDLKCVAGPCGGEFLAGPERRVVFPFRTTRYFVSLSEYEDCVARSKCPPEPTRALETRKNYPNSPAGRYLRTLALPDGEGAEAYCTAAGGSLLTTPQFIEGAAEFSSYRDGRKRMKPVGGACLESQLTLGCITSLSREGLGGRARVPQFLRREDGRLFVGGAGLFADEIEGVGPGSVAHVRCAW